MKPTFRRALGAAFACLGPAAMAQPIATTQPPADVPGGVAPSLRAITITAQPDGGPVPEAPALRLERDPLVLRARDTLGDTLDHQPGIASTAFGPNVGRPLLRGEGGDRVRVLRNGGSSADVSALSDDHAVPLEPLTVERIDVLRGPEALRYGSNAIGGVVNVVDRRIPREPASSATGSVDAGYATGSRDRRGAVAVEGGNERYALHVDAFDRRNGDVRVPIALECARPGSPTLARRMCNSAGRADGGAVGGTLFLDRGYLGASVETFHTTYGTVAEDDVTIGMRSNRAALAGAWRPAGGPFERVEGQLAHTAYRHVEYEGGAAGTTFNQRASELRLEARQRAWGAVDGSVGLQAGSSRFEALGEEAFVPPSRTRSAAVFAHERYTAPWGTLTLGARAEQVRVRAQAAPDDERFAAGERTFHPASAALGAHVPLSPAWTLTGQLAATQRAPRDYELFANGPHLATAAWQVGDPSLGVERSTGGELGAAWQDGPARFTVTAYAKRYGRYIGSMPTGAVVPGEEGDLPVYAYQAVRARFAGVEASGSVRLLGAAGGAALAPAAGGAGTLDLQWRADAVRASNRDSGEPLPQIAPARAGATLLWSQGGWQAGVGFDHAAAQRRVPDGTRPTSAYTLWNASFGWRHDVSIAGARRSVLWYARLDNITDRLAYSATSVLTTTAFPRAPIAGRSLRVGVRADF